jgi:hypothetical protein
MEIHVIDSWSTQQHRLLTIGWMRRGSTFDQPPPNFASAVLKRFVKAEKDSPRMKVTEKAMKPGDDLMEPQFFY